MSLGKFKKALTDFEFVAKRRPNDRDAAMKYTECNKLVRKQAFEKAISSDVPEKTLAEIHSDLESIGTYYFFTYLFNVGSQVIIVPKSICYLFGHSIEIEDDYDGPKLEDGKVTLKFMEELIEYYKNQKKLHRKFAYKVFMNYTIYSIYKYIYRFLLMFMDVYQAWVFLNISKKNLSKFTTKTKHMLFIQILCVKQGFW